MNVFFDTIGCRLNEAEVGTWARDFRRLGHTVVTDVDQAQLMVLNSCSVTSDAAKRSRQVVRRLHRVNPSAKLVITGCYSDLEPDAAKQILGVDAVIPNSDKDDFVSNVSSLLDVPTMPILAEEEGAQHVFGNRRTRAFVKVQDGCRNQCTFCVVTVARGVERSRSIQDIVDEVKHLSATGFREVVLTGVHIGGYGSDRGSTLRELLVAVLRETDIPRIRMGSLEPWDLPEDFFDLWSDSRLCPHLHLPLQSGSDSVLRRMARRCSVEEYRAIIGQAREAQPAFNITTDLIVGFPGETEAEFQETVANIGTMGFGHMHIFAYSRRAGTPAARMPKHVSRELKHERSKLIHEIAAEMKAAQFKRNIGEERLVLWEKPKPGETDSTQRLQGYTDNYFRVQMSAPANEVWYNKITPVRLLKLGEGGRFNGALV